MLDRILCALALISLLAAPTFAQEAPKQVTFGEKRDMDPMVSPDGSHLAFASDRTGHFNIFLVTFGKAGELQLTQSNKDDRYPNWSPDTRRIVFCSKRTGNGDIYEMSCDGSSGYLQLTDRVDLDEYPCYEAKRQGMIFASTPKRGLRLRPKMSVVFAKDKGQANNTVVLADGDEPRFSPDGTKIVFVSRRTKNNDIWLMNDDGGLQTQLTTDRKDDENPDFSPDGRKIVFASNRTGNFDIWVMDADGGNQRQLTTAPEDETQPSWSSGGYIYYTRRMGDRKSNIFRIKAP